MRSFRGLVVIATTLLLAGCSAVISPSPFGLQPEGLPHDIAGVWFDDNADYKVSVFDSSRGIIDITFNGKRVRVHMMEGADSHYASVSTAVDKWHEAGYYFARLILGDGEVQVFLPDADKFAELVSSGVISGNVVNGGVMLAKPDMEIIRVIEERDDLFEKDVLILKKRNK